MPDTVKVFVSYSHQDVAYLKDDPLLGFLKDLEKEGVDFWTERQIHPGELWNVMHGSSVISLCPVARRL
jgi:hypothetical protein